MANAKSFFHQTLEVVYAKDDGKKHLDLAKCLKVKDLLFVGKCGPPPNQIEKNKIRDASKKDLRAVLESSRGAYIVGLEENLLNGGRINQVLAKIAKDKKETFLLSFSFISSLDSRKRTKLFGMLRLALRLFIKYGVPFYVCALSKNPMDMRAQNEKESFIRLILKKNKKQEQSNSSSSEGLNDTEEES